MQNKRSLLTGLSVLAIIGISIFALHIDQTTAPKMPQDAPNVSDKQKWSEIFNDEFTGSTLDMSKWVTCYDWYSSAYNGCTNPGNKELEWYTPSQVSVKQGYAQLTATAKQTTGLDGNKREQTFPYQSGMISTGRPNWNGTLKSSYTYGYFETRMKVDSGKGLWPAFWLVPADKSWPPEIDVMEILGSKPSNVLMTYHWGTADDHQKDSSTFTSLTDPNGWHTYAVDWEPGTIKWYIDGQLRKSVSSTHVPSKAMEMLADFAVGGNLPGNPDDTTHFPASMKIDYIRVYKKL